MRKIFLFFYVFLVFGVSSCFANEKAVLRLALLPIPDVLPVFVAEDQGFFKEAGINVEILPVGSGLQRDQLMQAGKIDGMLNELASVANFNRQSQVVQVVTTARRPYENEPLFRLLAAKNCSVQTAEALAGVPVVISKNTVIDYITERMLNKAGLSSSDITTKSVASLPERYQLLLSGQIKAATLPEPLASSAITAGAVELVSDTIVPHLSSSVMTFSMDAITNKKEAVRKFVAAWNMAATELNTNADKYRPLMLKKIRVPKNVAGTYKIPQYPVAEVPKKEQWADTIEWMISRGLLDSALDYEVSINGAFLP